MLYTEKKDHLINKASNLTPEQKAEVITFFNKSPTRENEIDWNNLKNLTWADFEKVLKKQTKTGREKAVKKHGVKGLEEGKDYDIVYPNYKGIEGYLLYNYEAARLIASDAVGGAEGKWCIAYQKTDSYWNIHTFEYSKRFIVFVDYRGTSQWKKFVFVFSENDEFTYHFWDRYDSKNSFSNNEEAIKKVSGFLETPPINLERAVEKAKELVKKNEDMFQNKTPIGRLTAWIGPTIEEDKSKTFSIQYGLNFEESPIDLSITQIAAIKEELKLRQSDKGLNSITIKAFTFNTWDIWQEVEQEIGNRYGIIAIKDSFKDLNILKGKTCLYTDSSYSEMGINTFLNLGIVSLAQKFQIEIDTNDFLDTKLPLLKSKIQSSIIREFGYHHPSYDIAVTSEGGRSFIMDTLVTLTNDSRIRSSSVWKVLINPDFDEFATNTVLENILNNFH